MSRFHAAEPASQPKPKTDSEESAKSPAPHERQDEPDAHVEREWTVDEEGVVDEPSDRSGPDFNEDLDPTDAR